jgi:hypothetical protein
MSNTMRLGTREGKERVKVRERERERESLLERERK